MKNSVDKAIQEIRDQLEYIMTKLSEVCEDQITKINDSQQDQLAQLEDEAGKLQNCRDSWENLEKTVRDLLSQSNTSDFIMKSYEFLSSNQLKKLPAESDIEPEKLQYREPLSTKAFSAEDLSVFLQDNLLGFFASKNDEPISRIGNDPETSSLTESLRSATSLGTHSMDTYISHQSNISHLSRRTINTISGACHSVNEETDLVAELRFNMQPRTTATLWTKTDTKHFDDSHLKTFFSAMFRGESIWICGWNQNMFFSKDTVLVHANVRDYKLVKKHKMPDKKAHEPTIMFPFGESILFAKKGGNMIFNFNTQSHKFKDVLTRSKLTITALCGTGKHIFILDNGRPEDIQIFDCAFQPEGRIWTGMENVKDCDVDMCLINDKDGKYVSTFCSPRAGWSEKGASASKASGHADKIVVISTSLPCASVRAVNQIHGILWELNYRTSSQIDIRFDPCSVSASEKGDVFIADRGTNRVRGYIYFQFFKMVPFLLQQEKLGSTPEPISGLPRHNPYSLNLQSCQTGLFAHNFGILMQKKSPSDLLASGKGSVFSFYLYPLSFTYFRFIFFHARESRYKFCWTKRRVL